jgi:6-phosphogluconolactonase (cycloisomerase 2 family)
MKSTRFITDFLHSFLIFVVAIAPGSLWAQGNFVYTNDNPSGAPGSNTVSALSVGTDGTLTPIAGSPFPTGGTGDGGGFYATNRAVVNGKLLFVSNAVSGDVSVFTIDPTSGALTAAPGSPFKTGAAAGASALAPTPDGKFLMAANTGANTVSVFSVATNGALTLTAQFPTANTPDAAKVSPDGRFLGVAEPWNSSVVEMFSIAADGSLTSLGTFPGSGNSAAEMADVDINCANNMLYASEYNTTGTIVDAYSIGSGGTLNAISGSPYSVGGVFSAAVLLSPDNKTLFVSDLIPGTLAVASVAGDGSLSFLAGSPFTMFNPSTPSGIATSADGHFLYVANFKNTVSVFKVAADGTPTEVVGSPFPTGASGFGGLRSLAAFPPAVCAPPAPSDQTVEMMIKPPATPPVLIHPQGPGKVRVAILSSKNFNAVKDVDRSSLTFGHMGDEKSLAYCNHKGWDVNGDGLPDLVCHFRMPLAKFVPGDTTAYLKGKLLSGEALQASEAITDPQHVKKGRHGRDDDDDDCDDDHDGHHDKDGHKHH